MKYMWESEPLIDQATIMVEGKSDKSYLEMAIKELSDPLTAMIRENKLRIVTKEEGAGTTLIKKWVIAWLHSGNNAKLLAVFDKDCAGNSAVEALKKNELYSSQKLNKVKAMQLEPSDEIIELYKRKIHVPFEVEHLLSVEMWEKAIKKKELGQERNPLIL